jgi:hypothetical protein
LAVSSAAQSGKVLDAGHDDLNDAFKKIEVQRVDRIGRLMVMRVSEIGCVRQHDGGIPLIPEGCMVAPTDIRKSFATRGNGQRDGWK